MVRYLDLATMMKEYAAQIENLAVNQDTTIYANSGAEHAAIVFSAIFRYATTSVDIFAGDMCGNISDKPNYQSALKTFLEKKGKLRLLVENFKPEQNPTLYKLLSFYQFYAPEQVQVRELKPIEEGDPSPEFHFCVADDNKFRFEKDTILKTAIGSFNNPDFAQKLKEYFNDEFERSTVKPLN